MTGERARGLDRRTFVTAAVAIGGASALSACLERAGDEPIPQGPSDLSTLPERQHAWNEFLPADDHGNVVAPRHRVLLLLDYRERGPPSDAHRETLEAALRTVERAFRRGSDGLLFTLSYSRSYFDRFQAALPDEVDLPRPAALSPFEEPAFDEPDAVLHLASDHGRAVLAAEEALFGDRESLNGVAVEATIEDVFERTDRRTGFAGAGLPAAHQGVEGVPDSAPVSEEAPLFMGFKSGFRKNQASEDRVTIQGGPFAGGTTQHVSKLRLRLQDWYVEQDHEERVSEMFCPFHAEEGLVEGTGESLGDSSRIDECSGTVEEAARRHGRAGHSQKIAAVREDDSPIILRRDFNSTDGGEAGLHFLSIQRGIDDFVRTREAMNGVALTETTPAIRQRVNNGILEYVFVKRRGNYLLPPRSKRALPVPT